VSAVLPFTRQIAYDVLVLVTPPVSYPFILIVKELIIALEGISSILNPLIYP